MIEKGMTLDQVKAAQADRRLRCRATARRPARGRPTCSWRRSIRRSAAARNRRRLLHPRGGGSEGSSHSWLISVSCRSVSADAARRREAARTADGARAQRRSISPARGFRSSPRTGAGACARRPRATTRACRSTTRERKAADAWDPAKDTRSGRAVSSLRCGRASCACPAACASRGRTTPR